MSTALAQSVAIKESRSYVARVTLRQVSTSVVLGLYMYQRTCKADGDQVRHSQDLTR